MFTQTEKEWVLEAINHLKRRKARPDFSRISLRMKRRYHLSVSQTRKLLDSLVESGIVVKANYKNNTSYRDVSKWRKGKLGGQILNSNRMLQRFVKAITEKQSSTTVEEGKCTGVSAEAIEELLSQEEEDRCYLSGAALIDAIENEVDNGYLTKELTKEGYFYSVKDFKTIAELNIKSEVEDREPELDQSCPCYDDFGDENSFIHLLCDNEEEFEEKKRDFNTLTTAIKETEEEDGIGSTLENIEKWIKKMKKDRDPNCNKLPTALDNRVLFLEYLAKAVKAELIIKNVGAKTKDPLYSVQSGLMKIKDDPDKPQSDDEKDESTKAKKITEEKMGKLSVKTEAVSLRPPSKRKRTVKSHGPDFEMEFPTKAKKDKVLNGSTAKDFNNLPTALDSPVSEKSEATIEQSFKLEQAKKRRGRPKKLNEQTSDDIDVEKQGLQSEQSSVCQEDDQASVSDPPLPDASSWTTQQVADYFAEMGYEEESKTMLENEVDGAALALMRRSDIVGPPTGGVLKINKLGVALKLFRDIRNLLFQGNTDNYLDPYEERGFCRL